MKKILLLVFSVSGLCVFAQEEKTKAISEIEAFQKKLNEEYKNPKESPLEPKAIKRFKSHEFFPANVDYRVTARLTVLENPSFFQLKTTTSRLPEYRIYGYAEFELQGKTFKLPIYQSKDLMASRVYADHLFFPFGDLTNGVKSYSGGRFIDLHLPPQGQDTIVIDFNQAYNPYCAYNHKYSCPLVPRENQMDIEVLAGVMMTPKK